MTKPLFRSGVADVNWSYAKKTVFTREGMFSLPFTPREVKATEAVLNRIYDAAYLGLRNDNLAIAAGMLPVELNHLIELDPAAELAARQGRADAEAAHARKLAQASMDGDAKASLAILQHVHGWTAKHSVELTADGSLAALAEALGGNAAELLNKMRVIEHDPSPT